MRTNHITRAITGNFAATATIASGMVNAMAICASRLKSKWHSLHAWLKAYSRHIVAQVGRSVGVVADAVSGERLELVLVTASPSGVYRPDADLRSEVRSTRYRQVSSR